MNRCLPKFTNATLKFRQNMSPNASCQRKRTCLATVPKLNFGKWNPFGLCAESALAKHENMSKAIRVHELASALLCCHIARRNTFKTRQSTKVQPTSAHPSPGSSYRCDTQGWILGCCGRESRYQNGVRRTDANKTRETSTIATWRKHIQARHGAEKKNHKIWTRARKNDICHMSRHGSSVPRTPTLTKRWSPERCTGFDRLFVHNPLQVWDRLKLS